MIDDIDRDRKEQFLKEIEENAEKFMKEEDERNALIVEGLVLKMHYYLDDQAQEEFYESLDDDHKAMLTGILKYSNLIKK